MTTHIHTHTDMKDKRCRAPEEILASKTQINYSIHKVFGGGCNNIWDVLINSLQLKHGENIGH